MSLKLSRSSLFLGSANVLGYFLIVAPKSAEADAAVRNANWQTCDTGDEWCYCRGNEPFLPGGCYEYPYEWTGGTSCQYDHECFCD